MEVISWIDSHAFERWITPEALEADYRGNVVCHTLGYVAHEDEEAVILAQGYSLKKDSEDVEEWGHCWVIPKICITSRKELAMMEISEAARNPVVSDRGSSYRDGLVGYIGDGA